MPKNIRIKAQVGVDKEVKINLDQDFDRLEILSLSIHQSELYTRNCGDFGIIAGRVVANGGFGVPNAKIGVFIPLDEGDEKNEVIKALYPYKKIQSRNAKGYRYNLLPGEPDYDEHRHTGDFPKENEVLLNQEVNYVYDKYYKFTVKTNSSGDFLIYGVPVGNHQILMEVDLSSIGCFSLSPQDIIITGRANEGEFDGAHFKQSTSIDELPQIITQTKTIDVFPLWGEESICKAAINRLDFDLRDSGIDIQPTSVFIGSIGTDDGKNSVNRNCVPRRLQGDKCSLTTGPGSIEAIRQTVFTTVTAGGQTVPVLERHDFPSIINNSGAYVVNVPMNLGFIITNEFGEEEFSEDPTIGIPTEGKYRFRFKFLQDGSGARLRKRGEYLVPNIKEYQNIAPDAGANVGTGPGQISQQEASYSFSVNIDDYPSITDVIATNDYFYTLRYSQTYTTSLFLKRFHQPVGGFFGNFLSGKWRFIGIKRIKPAADKDCAGIVTDVPSNNAVKENSFSYILANIFNTFLTLLLFYLFYQLAYQALTYTISVVGMIPSTAAGGGIPVFNAGTLKFAVVYILLNGIQALLTGPRITLPLKNYDDCEDCACGLPIISFVLNFFNFDGGSGGSATSDGDAADGSCGSLPAFPGFPSDEATEINNQNAAGTQGFPSQSGPGCFTIGLGGNNINGILNGIETGIIALAVVYNVGIVASLAAALPIPWSGGLMQALAFIASNLYGLAFQIFSFAFYAAMAALVVFMLQALLLGGSSIFNGLMEWRIRRTTFDFLCEGGLSETFSNDWLNGFLYHFQFKMKVVGQTPVNPGVASYCEDILRYSEVQGKFYYRCSPFNFIGPYPHGQYDNLLYSTTLTELGVPNKQLKEACASAAGAEKCFMMPELGSTSRQSTSALVSYVGNGRLWYQMDTTTLWFFVGPATCFFRGIGSDTLDGDIAQCFAQNNQFGIAEFMNPTEANQSPATATPPPIQTAAENNPFYWNLAQIVPGHGQATDNNGICTIDFKSEESLDAVYIQPTRDCLLGGDIGICTGVNWTQAVPYYGWRLYGGGTAPFGTRANYWNVFQTGIIIIDHQPGPYFNVNTLSPISNNVAPTDPTYGPWGTPPWVTATPMRMSTHFHFYFGLRGGQTSYNEFSKRYIDTEENYV